MSEFGGNLACMSSPLSPGAIYWILILEYSSTSINMKPSGQDCYRFQICLKKGPNFLSCCLLKFSKIQSEFAISLGCILLGWILASWFIYPVGRDSCQLVCVLLIVWGQKISVFCLAGKIFSSRTQLFTEMKDIWCPSSVDYTAYQVDWLSVSVYRTRKSAQHVKIQLFCSWELSFILWASCCWLLCPQWSLIAQKTLE